MPADRPDLDLANLIRGVTPPASMMGRGVDLAKVKNKSAHKHRWAMLVKFETDDKLLAEMMEQKLQIANCLADEKPIPEIPPTQIPMGQENLVEMIGPGCMKCGAHWENQNMGFGKMCEVDDATYSQQQIAVGQELASNQSAIMAGLVEKARGGRGAPT